MMRFQAAITSGLAALLVPPMVLGQGSVETLEEALSQTTRALEILAGIQQTTEGAGTRSVDVIRAVTEAPILDDRRRDERLMDLRNQVNLLQTELDVLEAPAFLPEASAPPVEHAGIAGYSGDRPLPNVRTGLSPAELQALTSTKQPAPSTAADKAEEQDAGTAPAIDEGAPTYSADPVKHARACYYARRYERCLLLVEDLTADPEAFFWKSRSLEKLGRLDEAVEAMKRSVELAGDSPAARRAQAEVEFLEWRRSFLQDAPHLPEESRR